jgi:anti-sigma regulatory factor (Ser/Thr protein kinase)
MITINDHQDDGSVQITLSNRIGYEKIAMACSASFAEMYGFARDRIEDLKTIVAEASTNAMAHGNKGRLDAKVIVTMSCEDDTIYVSVADEGSGIEKYPPTPDIGRIIENNEAVCGFGLFLIKQLADKVDFTKRSDKGHVVHMALNMKAQADHAA